MHAGTHLQAVDPNILYWLDLLPGVPIFFVVSGYLVTDSLVRSRSVWSYFRNRFLRIYPALWVCFAVSCAALLVLYPPMSSAPLPALASWLAAQLSVGQFYTAEFLRGYGVGTPNGSLWTIPIELQFYFVLPLIQPLLTRSRQGVFLVVLLIAVLIVLNRYYVWFIADDQSVAAKLFGVTVFPYLYLFVVGAVLNVWRDELLPFIAGKGVFWLSMYAVTIGGAMLLGSSAGGNLLNPISGIVLGVAAIACAYTSPELADQILRRQDVSYGVYIYHMVVVNALVALGYKGSPMALIFAIGITLLLASISWTWVERPALRLKGRDFRDPPEPCMQAANDKGGR